MTKICTKCGREFPTTTEYFRKSKNGKYGLQSRCKSCKQKYDAEFKDWQKEYREKHKEEAKEYSKRYREQNAEQLKVKKRKYYEDNLAIIKVKQAQYSQEHAEQICMRSKKWRFENYEKYRLYNKVYEQRNIERVRLYKAKWSKNHPEHARQTVERRNTRKMQLPNDFSLDQWNECKTYFNNKCAYCGIEEKLEQDHFVPLSKGGEYTINNIVPACKSCNSSKSNKDFFEWYSTTKNYSKHREQKILKYLNYTKEGMQQLALII